MPRYLLRTGGYNLEFFYIVEAETAQAVLDAVGKQDPGFFFLTELVSPKEITPIIPTIKDFDGLKFEYLGSLKPSPWMEIK